MSSNERRHFVLDTKFRQKVCFYPKCVVMQGVSVWRIVWVAINCYFMGQIAYEVQFHSLPWQILNFHISFLSKRRYLVLWVLRPCKIKNAAPMFRRNVCLRLHGRKNAVGYARTNVIGSRTSFFIASLRVAYITIQGYSKWLSGF